MMNLKIYTSLILLLGITIGLSAQTKKVTGVVTAFNKYTLKGVQIKARKSKQIVKTDSYGYFEIECKEKDALNISAGGFVGVRISVNDKTSVKCNLVMLKSSSAADKIVSDGYMTQEEVDYAVENLMDENNDFSRCQNITEVLQSKYPMVRCEEVNGTFRVFTSSRPQSITAGGWALCVVDGIPTEDISAIAPAQVADVEVLAPEDAAEWGVRAGNGVVEIRLKTK